MRLVAHDLRASGTRGSVTELVAEDGAVTAAASGRPAAPDLYLSRGWLDLQVNGFAGRDANAADITPTTIEALAADLWAEGVAGFLPTVITAPAGSLERSLEAIAEAATAEMAGPSILGSHLEGPWISPEDGARGAHALPAVQEPDVAVFDGLFDASRGTLRLLTLAPERPGAVELIRHARRRRVVVAIGHSMADQDAVLSAVEAGASLSTHLGNGAPALLPRHPNIIWDQLAEDRLTASVIFDGHHLPEAVMRVILRAKGIERVILVSDSTAVARLEPGVYDTAVGGRVELLPSGRLCIPGTDYLAGSASSLLDCVNVAVSRLGCSPATVARLAADNPRRLLGLEHDSMTVFHAPPGGPVRVVATVVEDRLRYVDATLVP